MTRKVGDMSLPEQQNIRQDPLIPNIVHKRLAIHNTLLVDKGSFQVSLRLSIQSQHVLKLGHLGLNVVVLALRIAQLLLCITLVNTLANKFDKVIEGLPMQEFFPLL